MATAGVTMRPKMEQLPSVGEGASSPASHEGEQAELGEAPPRRNTIDLNYMHRPPTILPNYGKRKGVLKLKTNIPRVLLFDNVTQQTMLEVELSGLQSQRHKADRELSMQARSFMLRRQFKERYLKNLTKVFHDDDYWDFEQEYFGLASGEGQRTQAWQASGHSKRGKLLPSLCNGKGGTNGMGRLQTNKISRAGKDPSLSKERRSTADANGAERRKKEVQNGGGSYREFSLPQIKISPPTSMPQEPPPSHIQQLSPPGKVGFRFQKTPSGITRIFHAYDETERHESLSHPADVASTISLVSNPDNNNNNESANNKNNNLKNSDERETVEDADEQPRPVIKDRQKTNPFSKRPKPKEDLKNSGPRIIEDMEPSREFPITTDQPTQDHRFKVLNRVLVKQEPPNDGYIELSPSFTPQGPINRLRHRIKELHLQVNTGRNGSSRSRSARENLSVGVTPELSEEGHSDTDGEQEKEDEEANARQANDALLRLGGV
ncbi:hypothetical protein PoB_002033500 [Plakobranchus ocellatus]|uniref:Uncharacterized protein n=1 Tax=Plakobranchus ocellatus TaxID=259542 RepID=A0AAV3ZDZ1_9GAST|nr:hypothetical protein PoB_002033500 [Plakobranchus ocellatus]